jgi:drug/metabolite transporter (DMT)-like permease
LTATPSSSRSGWIAVAATICIWTGFILVSRAGGKGMLTGWDVAGLRFGVGGLIALFFLARVSLPPLKVIALFSVFGGIGYAVTVYSAFRLAPAAHASVLMPGALPFATAVIAWLWLRQAPSRPQRVALGLVFAGIVLTAADTLSHGARLTGLQLLGDALFLCGSSAWAAFTLLLRRYPMPPLAATVATTLGSAVVYCRSGGCSCPAPWARRRRPRSPCRRCIRACWWYSSRCCCTPSRCARSGRSPWP